MAALHSESMIINPLPLTSDLITITAHVVTGTPALELEDVTALAGGGSEGAGDDDVSTLSTNGEFERGDGAHGDDEDDWSVSDSIESSLAGIVDCAFMARNMEHLGVNTEGEMIVRNLLYQIEQMKETIERDSLRIDILSMRTQISSK